MKVDARGFIHPQDKRRGKGKDPVHDAADPTATTDAGKKKKKPNAKAAAAAAKKKQKQASGKAKAKAAASNRRHNWRDGEVCGVVLLLLLLLLLQVVLLLCRGILLNGCCLGEHTQIWQPVEELEPMTAEEQESHRLARVRHMRQLSRLGPTGALVRRRYVWHISQCSGALVCK